MKITGFKKVYNAPLAKAVAAKSRGMLCQSRTEGKNTEKFTVSGHRYGDDDFE